MVLFDTMQIRRYRVLAHVTFDPFNEIFFAGLDVHILSRAEDILSFCAASNIKPKNSKLDILWIDRVPGKKGSSYVTRSFR